MLRPYGGAMGFNPEIHHRRSIRLRDYDYSRAGAYFVTIIAWQRECLFGEVVDGMMRLNDPGRMALECWDGLPGHFPHVKLDEFVVMPNHFHAILSIVGNVEANVGAKQGVSASPDSDDDAHGGNNKGEYGNNKGEAGESFASPLPHGTVRGSLGAIIQNFKSVSTRKINKIRKNPGAPVWQRNYYERVIRDDRELDGIRRYIAGNPVRWEEDENHPARVESII